MASPPRSIARILLAALALAAAGLLVAALMDRRAPRQLLPAGAVLALEAGNLEDILERLEDTRFAAAFLAGPAYAWLEQSEPVRAVDGLRAGIGSAIGVTPRRRHILELVGHDVAAAWYPPSTAGAKHDRTASWLAAGRLSLGAWPVAGTARIALRLGLGAGIARERVADSAILTVGAGGSAFHVFFSGRLFVLSNSRDLIDRAARLHAGGGQPLAEAPDWTRVFSRLPKHGELRLWARGDLLPRWATAPGTARAVGAVLSAGSPVAIDAFVDMPDLSPAGAGGGKAPPGLALGGPAPLFFHSSVRPIPRAIADLIDDRAAAVARRAGAPAARGLAHAPGYALALTAVESAAPFPRPDGILAIEMRDTDASAHALHLLFPPGARAATGRWGTAFATRESLPLAGEFELWGAAVGRRLVLATQRSLIEGLAQAAAARPEAPAAGDEPLDSLTTINVTKLLPALRRYAPPLAGLVRARYRGAPDISGDFDLVAAVRSIAVTTATSPAGVLARVTLDVGDLPAAR